MYYRATKGQCDILVPKITDVEMTDEDGYLVEMYGEPVRSNEKVLCFSSSPGGAVLGATTGEFTFRGGKFSVCVTNEKPDLKIRSSWGDFPVIREVRYYRPVRTRLFAKVNVDKILLSMIIDAYGYMINTGRVSKIRNLKSMINSRLIRR